ncbi:MAG: helix-hairpin-helix domain-containing protein [Prevotella sp.]
MKSIFYLQDNDRKVLILCLFILVTAVGVFFFVGERMTETPAPKTDSIVVADGYRTKPVSGGEYYEMRSRSLTPFPFDPNTAEPAVLLDLGLSPRLVRNICKYRARGGVFSCKEDFKRIYGLTMGEYRQLEPYIEIGADYRPASESYSHETEHVVVRDTVRYPVKLREGQHVAVNSADTSMLKRVPGIGSHYAAAVVRYRERLGGFYSVGQLLEIGGFPESALKYFVVDGSPVRSIDINHMTVNQLCRHPYVGFYQARTIVEHRRKYGNITSLDDLSLYRDFPPEAIRRLCHYVRY